MADEGAETPTVLPKIDFYFVLQTAASDISNQHIRISNFLLSGSRWLTPTLTLTVSLTVKYSFFTPSL